MFTYVIINMKLMTKIATPYITGLNLGTYTYMLSHIMDYTISRSDTLDLIKKSPQLYVKSNISNFKNLIGLSPIYYVFADNLILLDKSTHLQGLKLFYMLMAHNILFYNIHKLFHKVKSLYPIHKFHHTFVKPIPSNGNAVSITEYNIAYVLPFLLGALLVKPNGVTFQATIAVISILNCFMHCVPLQNFKLPFSSFLVMPFHHLLHHEKLSTKYASPLLNVDGIKEYIEMTIQKWDTYVKWRQLFQDSKQ